MQKFVPIFFSKADLDAALGKAHSTQQGSQQAAYVKKADKCKETYDAECDKFAKAGNEKAKAAARKRLEKAQEEEAQWRAKARHVAEAGLPQVRVLLAFGTSKWDCVANGEGPVAGKGAALL